MRNHDYKIFKKISFTKIGSYCNFRLNVIRDGISESYQIPLSIIGNNPLPNDSYYPSTLGNGQTQRDVLPFCYVGDLFQAAVGITDFPKGTHNRILFLFGFEGSEFVYIVSPLSNGIRQDDIPFLSLSFNTEYEIQIELHVIVQIIKMLTGKGLNWWQIRGMRFCSADYSFMIFLH